jgi:hypothetical protein
MAFNYLKKFKLLKIIDNEVITEEMTEYLGFA